MPGMKIIENEEKKLKVAEEIDAVISCMLPNWMRETQEPLQCLCGQGLSCKPSYSASGGSDKAFEISL